MEFNKRKVIKVISQAAQIAKAIENYTRLKHQIADLANKSLHDEVVTNQVVESLESMFNVTKTEVLKVTALVQTRYSSECDAIAKTIEEGSELGKDDTVSSKFDETLKKFTEAA